VIIGFWLGIEMQFCRYSNKSLCLLDYNHCTCFACIFSLRRSDVCHRLLILLLCFLTPALVSHSQTAVRDFIPCWTIPTLTGFKKSETWTRFLTQHAPTSHLRRSGFEMERTTEKDWSDGRPQVAMHGKQGGICREGCQGFNSGKC